MWICCDFGCCFGLLGAGWFAFDWCWGVDCVCLRLCVLGLGLLFDFDGGFGTGGVWLVSLDFVVFVVSVGLVCYGFLWICLVAGLGWLYGLDRVFWVCIVD